MPKDTPARLVSATVSSKFAPGISSKAQSTSASRPRHSAAYSQKERQSPSFMSSSKAVASPGVIGDAAVFTALLSTTPPASIKREDEGSMVEEVLREAAQQALGIATHRAEPNGIEGLEIKTTSPEIPAGTNGLALLDNDPRVLQASPTPSEGGSQLPPSQQSGRVQLEQPRRAGDRTASEIFEEGFVLAEVERFRLEHAIETIDLLNERIKAIERTEHRLRKQLRDEKERLKDSKAYGEGLLNLLVLAEEKMSNAETVTATLRCDIERYRGWWITEYYSLRALFGMLSREQRVEARVIREAAEERYTAWLNMQE
ncbi:hypothetical protein FA13DRAFT_1789206 [Coprinellus micaceus]|uniref:Uncharacterized protein n=1 Tax=Coprinellus micaceus TaxID=71717 RepID=A0A4Y7TIK3_COPMI|nr:hypothetical protein FA13DRAFT_1789206 [Coprinellus micaceus]